MCVTRCSQPEYAIRILPAYVKTGGHFIPYKSGRIQEELTEAKTAIKSLAAAGKTEKFQLADTDMEDPS